MRDGVVLIEVGGVLLQALLDWLMDAFGTARRYKINSPIHGRSSDMRIDQNSPLFVSGEIEIYLCQDASYKRGSRFARQPGTLVRT